MSLNEEVLTSPIIRFLKLEIEEYSFYKKYIKFKKLYD